LAAMGRLSTTCLGTVVSMLVLPWLFNDRLLVAVGGTAVAVGRSTVCCGRSLLPCVFHCAAAFAHLLMLLLVVRWSTACGCQLLLPCPSRCSVATFVLPRLLLAVRRSTACCGRSLSPRTCCCSVRRVASAVDGLWLPTAVAVHCSQFAVRSLLSCC
jgi:hypothetical protein